MRRTQAGNLKLRRSAASTLIYFCFDFDFRCLSKLKGFSQARVIGNFIFLLAFASGNIKSEPSLVDLNSCHHANADSH